jgi:hypothetical protein
VFCANQREEDEGGTRVQEFSALLKGHISKLTSQVKVKVKVKVTLRLTVSHSVRLGVEPNLGLLTRFFFFKFIVLSFWERPI